MQRETNVLMMGDEPIEIQGLVHCGYLGCAWCVSPYNRKHGHATYVGQYGRYDGSSHVFTMDNVGGHRGHARMPWWK